MKTKKEYIQITREQAKSFFNQGLTVKICNQKTGKIRRGNASKEDIFNFNQHYFIEKI